MMVVVVNVPIENTAKMVVWKCIDEDWNWVEVFCRSDMLHNCELIRREFWSLYPHSCWEVVE